MQKWEYCEISGLPVKSVGHIGYNITFAKITLKGREVIKAVNPATINAVQDAENAVASFIAQLGEEGWEMVGTASTSEDKHTLYFKRPK